MKKEPPDVIHIENPKDTRIVNLYCLVLYAFDTGNKYLLSRALQRLNQLTK